MTNSVDPDQLASSEANWSGFTLFAKVRQQARFKTVPLTSELMNLKWSVMILQPQEGLWLFTMKQNIIYFNLVMTNLVKV